MMVRVALGEAIDEFREDTAPLQELVHQGRWHDPVSYPAEE